MEEIEVKYLNINPDQIEKKLVALGAKKIFDRFFKREVWDFPDLRLNKQGAWIRVRDEGDKTTLVFKQRVGIKSHDGTQNDESMEEIEIEVDDFSKTSKFLEKIGLDIKFLEENRRICYRLGEIEFDIDFWPMLDPYLEIEGPSWEKVEDASIKLGLDPKEKKIFSTHQIYKLKGINELEYSKITFKEIVKRESEK